MLAFNVFVIFLLVLFIFLVAAGVKIVPQGYNFTVERFGRYTRTLRPALTLIIPFIDRIGRKLNMMEQGDRSAESGGHHARQRDGARRRHRFLPGARCGAGEL